MTRFCCDQYTAKQAQLASPPFQLEINYSSVLCGRPEAEGVRLRAGDTVVDVGANVGLFTLQAADIVGPQGQVVAVEPSPDAHTALLENLATYADLNVQAGSAKVAAVQAAAGSTPKDAINLVTYSQSSGWSTVYPDEQEVQEGMRMFLNNALPSMQGIENNLLSQGARVLRLLTPRPLYEAVWRLYVGNMLAQKEIVQCQQRTLSDIIAEHGIKTIDLLKIDVERAELDVLAGLSPENWSSIRQLVMEMNGNVGHIYIRFTLMI
ncbi:hypothetical protein WJX73_006362 [Symbiochloris irregularis]|uniref:Methyltransferase FkbM domain-containing protein n=1 Tax=Symbiochloris irregularis TaxID=706552 RepID=A0AAW1PMM1_9CHLO